MASAMRKAQRQLQREQEKRSRKYQDKPKTSNEILGIKSIAEYQKDGVGKMIGDQLKLAWYFEKWYEKLILVGLCAMGLWKIVGLVL